MPDYPYKPPCPQLMFLPRKVDGKIYAIVMEDFRDVEEDRTVHAGMPTDGMSSLRAAWLFWPPYSSGYLAECLVHDHDCKLAASLPPGEARDRERLEADRRFRRNLRRKGAGAVTAQRLYAYVRAGAKFTAKRDATPFYSTDPEGAYRALGILDQVQEAGLWPWSSEMRMGGKCW